MKFSEMNKDQKQLLILAIGGVITLVMVSLNLVIKPAQQSAAAAELLIADLEQKVNLGDRLLARDLRVRMQTKEDALKVLKIYESHLPPDTNRYGWALKKLNGLSEKINLRIFVTENNTSRFIAVKQGETPNVDSVPMWVSYSVTIDTRTNFENLKKFLKLLEKEFPYSSVANMQISPTDSDPENHIINFTIEWPILRFNNDLVWLTSQVEGTNK